MDTEGTAAKPTEKSGIARNTIIYAIGNISRQLAGFIMLPVYTRYLTPADYGAVGLLAFAMALLEPFFGARLAQSVPKFYFETNSELTRRAILTSAITLTASVSAISALLIAIFSQPASSLLFGTTDYALATALFGLNILTQPIEHTGMMFIRLQERAVLFLTVSMGKLALQITLNLLFIVHMEMGVIGVVLSGIIASTIIGILLTSYVFYHKRPKLDLSTTWKMVVFCWPLWFAGLAGLYVGSANRVYLRVFSSLDQIGLIELGTRFASIVGVLIWAPFIQQWETTSYKYYNQKNAKPLFQTAFLTISTLLIVAGLGISIFADPIILIMSDKSFHGASTTVPFLTFGFIFLNLTSFFHFGFLVTNNPKMYSRCHYLTAAAITLFFISLIPTFGATGASVAQAFGYAFHFLLIRYLSKKYFDPEIPLYPLAQSIAISACVIFVCNTAFRDAGWGFSIACKALIYLCASALILTLAMRSMAQKNPDIYHEWLAKLVSARMMLTMRPPRK
jgi:O-antigen/teichoic acid export membrane protein